MCLTACVQTDVFHNIVPKAVFRAAFSYVWAENFSVSISEDEVPKHLKVTVPDPTLGGVDAFGIPGPEPWQ